MNQTDSPLTITEILEQYPSARMIYKQMDRNNDTRNRLERLRMRALKKADWETAASLETELAWCRSEGNTLTDQMVKFLDKLKAQGVQMV